MSQKRDKTDPPTLAMSLFDETENIYYEFIAELLSGSCEEMTTAEIMRKFRREHPENTDTDIIKGLLSTGAECDGGGYLFREVREEKRSENGNTVIRPMEDRPFPIRMSILEKQAAATLADLPYAEDFLSEDTIVRLGKASENVPREWDPSAIILKNRLSHRETGDMPSAGEMYHRIHVIREAIARRCAIQCDNNANRPERKQFRRSRVYPVRIEYSLYKDRFWVWAWSEKSGRFIRMNMESVSNVSLLPDDVREELRERFDGSVPDRTVTLRIDPSPHHIDRSFRVFSCYDRTAEYDEKKQEYTLRIRYSGRDEKELISSILQMGPNAIVLEPEEIRQKVYARIKKAVSLYAGDAEQGAFSVQVGNAVPLAGVYD